MQQQYRATIVQISDTTRQRQYRAATVQVSDSKRQLQYRAATLHGSNSTGQQQLGIWLAGPCVQLNLFGTSVLDAGECSASCP